MVFNNVINYFFDKRCILCKKINRLNLNNIVCNECIKIFQKEFSLLCKICKHPIINDNECPSCSRLGQVYYNSYDFIQFYTGFFKNLIYQLKKNGNYIINKLFYSLIIKKKLIKNDGIITVVPDLLINRVKKGRSSLYYLLKLLRKSGFNVKKNIYKKCLKFNKNQKSKNVKNRIEEISKSFHLPKKNNNNFKGKVYLIDDIYTTGATLNYGAKLLKLAGFDEVHIVSFLRSKLEDIR